MGRTGGDVPGPSRRPARPAFPARREPLFVNYRGGPADRAKRRSPRSALRRRQQARGWGSARTRSGTRFADAPAVSGRRSCARFRNCSATRASARRSATHTSTRRSCSRYTQDRTARREQVHGTGVTAKARRTRDARRRPFRSSSCRTFVIFVVNVAVQLAAATSGAARRPLRNLDPQRLDLVVHHARADRQQLRGVLLHPVRHLQRLDQRVPLDVLERDAGRRNLHDRRVLARAARRSALRRAAGRSTRWRVLRPAASPARSCSRARGCCRASCSASAASARPARARRSSSSARRRSGG